MLSCAARLIVSALLHIEKTLLFLRVYIHQIEPIHISLTLDVIRTCCFIGKQIQIQLVNPRF